MVDPELLAEWNYGFYGYGTWAAPIWFIGLEEGGVDSADDFETRVNEWDRVGQPELLDLQDFHRRIGHDEYCRIDAPLQSTWRRLMRTLFVASNRHPTDQSLRSYQASLLGSTKGETALIELSPLPARAVNDRWFQRNDAASLEFIDLDELKDIRRDRIGDKIDHYRPSAVVSYGDARRWSKFFDLERETEHLWVGRRATTTIIASPQGRIVQSNEHWDGIGRIIKANIAS